MVDFTDSRHRLLATPLETRFKRLNRISRGVASKRGLDIYDLLPVVGYGSQVSEKSESQPAKRSKSSRFGFPVWFLVSDDSEYSETTLLDTPDYYSI